MLHETGGLKWLTELGSKSYFDRYEGRKDLGNNQPGDGYKFRGRGLIHITGRYNYTKYGKLLDTDLVENPELATDPDIAIIIALEYWDKHDLNLPADDNDIKKITKKINGGYNGLYSRGEWLKLLQKVIK